VALLHTWLLLHYKLPSEPSARRVYVWRKLKRLGALLWQDAIWTLPLTTRTQEQFQWLTAEIIELGGEAALWQAQSLWPGQEPALVQQFNQQAETLYNVVLAALAQPEPDVAALGRQYQQAQAIDYFHTSLGQHVREMLLTARGDKI
jgi:hypothetical protein